MAFIMQVLAGVSIGLTVAFLQAITYILSKNYYDKTRTGTLTLLSLSHIEMGAGAVLILLVIWPRHISLDYLRVFGLVAAVALPYFLGQAALLGALKSDSPSRITPLLTFKVVVIALESVVFFGATLGSLRWLGIGLSTLAMFFFNLPGEREKFGLKSLLLTFVAVISYANSDLAITRLVTYLNGQRIAQASLFGTCLSYLLTGIIALGMLFTLKDNPRQFRLWKYAFPFAAVWIFSIVLLFQTFLLIGPILGTLLQSVRGILSVVLGAFIAYRGYVAIEEQTSRSVFLRRLITTLLMTGGIGLYLWGGG